MKFLCIFFLIGPIRHNQALFDDQTFSRIDTLFDASDRL